MYQSYPFTLEAILKYGDSEKYKIEITASEYGEGTVLYTEPSALAGLRYDVYNGTAILNYSDLTLPLSIGMNLPAINIIELFSLTSDGILNAEVVKQNGMTLNLIKFDSVNLYLTRDCIPVRIESDLGFTLDIVNFNKQEVSR